MIGVPANRLELLTQFYYKQRINPQTYTQIDSPTVVQKEGVVEHIPRVFDMLQYFETTLSSVKTFDLLMKMKYVLCSTTSPTTAAILAAISDFTKK